MSKKLSMRVATHALIAGLVLTTGGYGAAAPAFGLVASQDDHGTPSTPPDSDHVGSLTIHKRLNPSSPLGTPTGNEDSTVTGDQFNGVEFHVQQVDADLTTNAGLKAAAKLTVKSASVKSGGYDQTKATAGDGTVKFDDLPVGVYKVTEVTPLSKKATVHKTNPKPDDENDQPLDSNVGVQTASPFLVFIPMTNPSDTSKWNYDVVAYPKNNSFTLKKEVAKGSEDVNVGEDITYDISGDRPVFDPTTEYIDYYQLVDEKPAGFTYKSVVVKIGDTALTKDADYQVTSTDTNPTVTLTVAGEEKLMEKANAGKQVKASFTFSVDSLAKSANGDSFGRTNRGKAHFETKKRDTPTKPTDNPKVPGNPENPKPNKPPKTPEVPSNPVTEYWVPVKIKKVDADSNDTLLPGAVFNVYRCTAKSDSPEDTKTGAEGTKVGNKLTVNGETNFTTADKGPDKGTVVIDALRLRDKREATDGYCLVETKAPEGYELNPKPYFFRLDETLAKDTSTAPNKQFQEVTVEDSKSVGPKLPATGGMGVGLLMALGAIVVGAGAFFARRSSKAEA